MPPSDGWHLAGPLIAFALVGVLAGVLSWSFDGDPDPLDDLYADGLDLLDTVDDYGLLIPAALADHPDTVDEVRRLLRAAGIRSTQAFRPDGRIAVLVFPESVDEARRLAAGGSPSLG
jgi:hypothetical protein